MPFTIDTSIPPQVWNVGQLTNLQLNMATGSTPAPSGWSATGLPSGVTISSAGLVSGLGEIPGVYDVVVTATGSGPVTDTVAFQMGITDRAGESETMGGAIEVDFDLRTGLISVPVVTPPDGLPPRILHAKRGDRVQLAVGFTKDGVLQDLDISTVTVAMKRYEPEGVLALSDGTANKIGQWESARWVIDVYLDPDDVSATLSDEEGDDGTSSPLLTEIQAVWDWYAPGVDPEDDPAPTPTEVRRTSQTFGWLLERDWIDD